MRRGTQTFRRIPSPLAVAVALLLSFTVGTLSMPTAHATNGVVKEMTFLLHSVNATETAKPLPGGGSTLTYFDTTLNFNDVNVSVLVEGAVKVLQWFLSPSLAGDFSADAVTLRIWANSSTAASSNAQVTLEIFEVNATASTRAHQINLGNQNFPVTPTLRSWSSAFAALYTFRAGSSVEVRLTVTPGALQGVWFHYDTPQVNSRVSFRGPDSLDVAAVAALDSSRTPRVNFDPDAADKTVYLQARITDPLGGYDIRWVNATLTAPSGVILLNNVSMAKVAGTPVGFESTFEVAWNYAGQPIGRYEVVVWALDNNGHNHHFFFQQFTYADYPDVGTATFFVGGPTVYVNVKAVDSRNAALAGATVTLVSGGVAVDAALTDDRGIANVSGPKGSYVIDMYWQDVRVASSVRDLQGNVTDQDPLVITTAVFYPVFQAQDAEGVGLAGATLFLTHPNGEKLGPYKADEDGQVALAQLPGGTYGLVASWRGIEVYSGIHDIAGNGVIAFPTAVYQLTVEARGGDGQPLAGVFVSVADATGLVFDAGLTDAGGDVVLRLPAGDYTVRTRYVTSVLGTLYDSGTRTTEISLTASTTAQVTFEDFPIPLTSTLAFLFALLYVASIAGLLTVLYLLHRRRSRRKVRLEQEP